MKSVRIQPVPPFRLDFSAWALRRSAVNGMDRWDGRTFRRVLVADNRAVTVSVVQEGSADAPAVSVSWEEGGLSERQEDEVVMTVRKMLGLDVDLGDFYRLAAANRPLAELVNRFSGLKPPRLPSVFETLINGIACQQLSLHVGILLLNRLCSAYGLSADRPQADRESAFPRPVDLAHRKPADLMELGFSRRKAEYILNFAAMSVGGELNLERFDDGGDDEVFSSLLALRGIGPWTAEYVMLRGLGRLNTIPADDVGIQNKLQKWLNLDERPSSGAIRQMFPEISPYRGLIYFFLLLDYLSGKGFGRAGCPRGGWPGGHGVYWAERSSPGR